MVDFGISLPNYRIGFNVTYELILEMAQECERLGLHSGWIADHVIPHRGPTTPLFECFTTLSAIARETKTLRLGTYVVCNTFRYPSLLAKMATCVDQISGGRLELGMGAGYNEIEHERYGIPLYKYERRIRQFREGVQIVKRMFTEEAPSFKGEFYEIHEAINNPKPIQKPHPPIWVGGKGTKLLKVVAEFADWWQGSTSFSTKTSGPEEYRAKSTKLNKYIVEQDKLPTQVKRSCGLTFLIDKNEDTLKERRKKYNLPEDAGGTPDQWINRFRAYIDVGVSQFILSIPDPIEMSHDMELLAECVIPYL